MPYGAHGKRPPRGHKVWWFNDFFPSDAKSRWFKYLEVSKAHISSEWTFSTFPKHINCPLLRWYTIVNCVFRMENAAANRYGMSRVQITFDFAADHTRDSLTTSIFDLIHQCWSSDRLAWTWWQMRPCSTVWFGPACVPKQIYWISRNLPVLFISFLIKYCLCVFGC